MPRDQRPAQPRAFGGSFSGCCWPFSSSSLPSSAARWEGVIAASIRSLSSVLTPRHQQPRVVCHLLLAALPRLRSSFFSRCLSLALASAKRLMDLALNLL